MNYEKFRDARSQTGSLAAAGQFQRLAKAMAVDAGDPGYLDYYLDRVSTEGGTGHMCAVGKSAAVSTDAWQTPDGRAMSDAYLAEAAPANLADAVKTHAVPIPVFGRKVHAYAGIIAEGVPEGWAKPVSALEVSTPETERTKVAAILAVTREVLRDDTPGGADLFRRLLKDSVIRASNIAFLAALPAPSNTVPAGANAVASLNAGLGAAVAAGHYVVAARPDICRELALASDGRMPVGGGEFSPGITVLPVEFPTSVQPDLIVIPADRIAMKDSGLIVRASHDASIELAQNPGSASSPATGANMVSLFQTGCVGLLVERLVDIAAGAEIVEVS